MDKMESERTRLRRLRLSDFDNMRLLETEASIMKFTPSRVPQTAEQTRKRIESQVLKQSSLAPFGIWVAEDKETDSFIGWFMLVPADNEFLELGFMLVRRFWNNGFATEICKTIIDFARTQKIAGLTASTSTDNAASMRVLEKIGFSYSKNIFVPEKVFGGEIELKVFDLKMK